MISPLQVLRPEGALASLLGTRSKLHVAPHAVRLSHAGDALLLTNLAERPPAAVLGAPNAPAHDDAPTTTLPLSQLLGVKLGAPSWCARAAAFDLGSLHRLAEYAEGAPPRSPGAMAAMLPEDEAAAAAAEDAAVPPPPPTWHFVTLQPRTGTPFFLCAPTAAQALVWVAGFSPLLPDTPSASASASAFPSLLWRRVRLRLDAHAARMVAGAAPGVAPPSRLTVLAAMLRAMAAEEDSRQEWVRFHLAHGDEAGAAGLGWEPPPPPPMANGHGDHVDGRFAPTAAHLM